MGILPTTSRPSPLVTSSSTPTRGRLVPYSADKCAICQDALIILDGNCIAIPCRHRFHEDCFGTFKQAQVQGTRLHCPVCRVEVDPNSTPTGLRMRVLPGPSPTALSAQPRPRPEKRARSQDQGEEDHEEESSLKHKR